MSVRILVIGCSYIRLDSEQAYIRVSEPRPFLRITWHRPPPLHQSHQERQNHHEGVLHPHPCFGTLLRHFNFEDIDGIGHSLSSGCAHY